MAHLSRVWMNPLRTGAQRLLRNPQHLHAAVLGGISQQPVTERVLWRLEMNTPHRAELLVLTASQPSWEHIVEQAGWPGSDRPQAEVRSYDPLIDRVQTGREFAFRVRVNPVSATKKPEKASASQQKQLATERPRGVRVPHRTAAQQQAWFLTHARGWGFDVVTDQLGDPAVRLSQRERSIFSKGEAGDRHRVTLSTATIDGTLRVVDSERLKVSLLGGIGPARAYGCGLLTLAPLRVS